jgi:HAD superfamily hydrolase (TIGR01509 family)
MKRRSSQLQPVAALAHYNVPVLNALLFDLDGTLADTDRLHEQAWLEALKPYGLEADHSFYQTHISGGVNPEIAARILPQLSPQAAKVFLDHKEQRFRELATTLEATPGLRRLLDWAREHRLKLALVSNAPRENAAYMLDLLGLEFPLKVLSDDLGIGKPDPLPYRVALQRMNLEPSQALAFEDSPAGVRSAKSAGIATVGITSGHNPAALAQAGAEVLVQDFEQEALWEYLRAKLP